MAQLNRLELEFGEETNPTILIQSYIDALTTAIGTKSSTHNYNVTQDQYGNTLLGGWIAPPEGSRISETDNYVLLANGVHVKADSSQITESTYVIDTGYVTTLPEGGNVQLYCKSSQTNLNITMTSMTVWVYLHFGISPQLQGVDKEDIMGCLNCSDWVRVDSTYDVWRGKLNSQYGIIESTVLDTKNAGWNVVMSVRAYPSLIDQNPLTDDTERERRCTPAYGEDGECRLTYNAVAVDRLEISCSNPIPTTGDNLRFTVTGLLPAYNTKVKAIPLSQVVVNWSLQETGIGAISGGAYTVPQGISAFTVIASISYMDTVISTAKTYEVSTAVLAASGSNSEMFWAVKDALSDWDYEGWDPVNAQAITNIIAANVPGNKIRPIMEQAFIHGAKNFEALEYFTQITELYIPEGINETITNIASSHIYRISGPGTLAAFKQINNEDFPNCEEITAGKLFQNNTVLTKIQFPRLRSIQITSEGGTDVQCFDGCSNLTIVNLPLLDNISGRDCYLFRGCSSITSMDLHTVTNFYCSRSNGMFKDCTSLGQGAATVSLFDFGNLNQSGDISIFENCRSLRSFDLSSATEIAANQNGSLTLFKGCTSLQRVNISPNLARISAVGGDLSIFDGCSSLRKVSSSNIDEIDIQSVNIITAKNNYMFRGCSTIQTIKLPTALSTFTVSSADGMFEGCTSIRSVTMPSGLSNNTLGSAANPGHITTFKDCTSLESVDWGYLKTIYSIDNQMFEGCSSLKYETDNVGVSPQLNISDITQLIGTGNMHMFKGCSSLKNCDLNLLTKIQYDGNNHMFKDCSALTSISMNLLSSIIGATGTDIMIDGCSQLASMVIPNLKTYKAGTSQIFKSCIIPSLNLSSLETIECINSEMFMSYTGNLNVSSLRSIITTNDYTFKGSGISSLNANNLTRLEASNELATFSDCVSLTSISMKNITTILSTTNNLFKNCVGLYSIDFGKYSDNQLGLRISGDATDMFKNVASTVISNELNSSEDDNVITSRITEYNVTNLWNGLNFDKVRFPHITTVNNSPAFTFGASRIKLG